MNTGTWSKSWRATRFRLQGPAAAEAAAVAVGVDQVNIPAKIKTNQVNGVSFLLCTQHKPRQFVSHRFSGIR